MLAGNETMMDNIIKEIDATELNAVVADFKMTTAGSPLP